MKKPIIIDCDPGHDDAIALLVALASDKLDVKAITTVAGNAYVENTTENALKVLELTKFFDIPVGMGARQPLIKESSIGDSIHGASGMDGPELPFPSIQKDDLSAVELMADVIRKSDEPVIISTLGPMTNLAIFILTYPELVSKIKYVSSMGGGLYESNWSSTGEFNIWNDPEAAQIVMESGLDVHLYGLDVTHKAQILPEEFERFANKGDVSQFVKELLEFFAIAYVGDRGLPGCTMHDSCAIMGIIKPELFKYSRANINIDLDGYETRGSVVADLRAKSLDSSNLNGRVYIDTNREEILELIIDTCEKLDERIENEKNNH